MVDYQPKYQVRYQPENRAPIGVGVATPDGAPGDK